MCGDAMEGLKIKNRDSLNAKEGYKIVARMIGSHNLSKEDRAEDDFYATSPEAAEWLIKIEDLNKNIWECACGKGHLSKVFEEHGFNVTSSDLVDRGYGIGGVNFLTQNLPFYGDIVTNPPYRYAQEFIEKALRLVYDGNKVCMFLKIQFLEGRKRKEFFKKYPPKTIWVSSSRIKCGTNGEFKGGSSMMALAWYVWEKGYTGDTVVKWFN